MLLLALFVQQRVAPAAFSVPPLPFFDRLVLLHRPFFGPLGWNATSTFLALQLAASLLLLANAWAILAQRRVAFPLFVASGWGGFVLTLAALWPGDETRFKLRAAFDVARRQGLAAPGATSFWDVVPASYYVIGGLALVAWIALLVAGTVHLRRAA